MKNAIQYYYNLITYDIRHLGKRYRFKANNSEYLLMVCDYSLEELEEIYQLNLFLISMNIYTHQIILNKDGNMITYINQEPYILMHMIF